MNYCMDHMNDTMARENNQVCWNHNVMEAGLKYAVAYLDGGTGRMVKAQSDIMTPIDNAYAALPRETLIKMCATTTGMNLVPEVMSALVNESLNQLVDCASGTPLNQIK